MNTRGLRYIVLLAVAASLLAVVGCARDTGADLSEGGDGSGEGVLQSNGNGELVVCISGMVTPDEGLTYYEGLSEYVASAAGLELRLIHKAEYAELNELLKKGEVDMAFTCSGPYVSGHDDFGLELLAAPVVNGVTTYQSYIIAAADSTAESIDAFEGKMFAFTDPNSNTGCLVPTYMLAVVGTTPEEFFGRTVFTYSHDNSIKAVATGEADGAAVDSLIWEYANDTDPTYTSKTRLVAVSEPFGIPPIVVRPGMDPELKATLQAALLGAHEDPVGRALLDRMHIEKFVAIDDSAYDSIRDINKWIQAQKKD
jgi:phosphonate transport system substrate-binding protein